MTDADDIERIRAAKRERLLERLAGSDATDQSAASEPATEANDPVEVEDREQFATVLANHRTGLADFYADWCGPCRMLAPIVERIATETPATVANVDTEANPELSQQFGVRSLPTLVLFVDGEPAERLVGMQEETRLRSVVERHASAAVDTRRRATDPGSASDRPEAAAGPVS